MESKIKSIHHDLASGKRSCLDIVQEKLFLLREKTYHTVNLLLEETAIAEAKKVDEKIKSGKPIGLLEGVPFGIKDVILLQNSIATGSSDFLKDYVSPYTATAIQKLIDAGAIPIVKENCDSFGNGNTSENTVFGSVSNATDASKVAGGSSGGSAVNVAKGYTAFSIGVDSGGSIRQPAGFNKIVGMKPTYGRVSRYGIMSNVSSTDCVGPLTVSLEDIRILLNAMSGKDGNDPTTCSSSMIPETVFDSGYLSKEVVAGYYPGFLDNAYIDDTIKSDFQKMLDRLSAKGIKIKSLDFFDIPVLLSVYYILAMAEEASNLARLDGSLYGSRSNRASNFSNETKSRIIGGNKALSCENLETIYLKAKSIRNAMIDSFNTGFKEVDVILSPVSPTLPPVIGSSLDHPLAMYFSDAFTAGFSLGGLPTLSVPFFTQTGIQIASNKNQEDLILNFAHALKEIQ